jgi:galactokinase
VLTIDNLKKSFIDIFGEDEGLRFFFAPGRVNLIGEHIDYSGGYVLPCAINLGTYMAVRKRADKKLLGFSQNFREKGIVEVDLNDTSFRIERGWMNYVVGVFDTLKNMGHDLSQGFEFYIEGDLPKGAGLSSSASIEVVTAYAVNQFFDLNLSKVELAKLCQISENQYNGVKCGIMDQFAVAMGKKDRGILLDCNSLNYQYVPLNLYNKSLVIINSNKQRTLVDSKYNERRESCERALDILKQYKNINNLCDIKEGEFENLKEYLQDTEIRKRAKHAITENERVLKAAAALRNSDLAQLAQLMKESHLSLRDDYEVSVDQLDKLAQLSWDFQGVWGARMTGAGFGGCTVNIVENHRIDEFIRYVSREYFEATGLKADFYLASISEGVHEIKG